MWDFDNALRLYPLPHAVFVGGVCQPFDHTYKECAFASVGPFHREASFYSYHPVREEIYPCDVVPFSKIEEWYQAGEYVPYAERDPQLLVDLLVHVKPKVHPWIRLNRVVNDIPKESIIAGNKNQDLRQRVFEQLALKGRACRCIRCREVRGWTEAVEHLSLKVRQYRSSGGDEFFVSVEGGDRGLGGGSTQRALPGSGRGRQRPKKGQPKQSDHSGSILTATPASLGDNPSLYGLLRLRLNDDLAAPAVAFPELSGCALIRELHVYGQMIPTHPGEAQRVSDQRAQHRGIGRVLMERAEAIAAARGFERIAVIAGVGVRHYYRRLGYELVGEGRFLIKPLPPAGRSWLRSLADPYSAAMTTVAFQEALLPAPPLALQRQAAASPA